MTFKVPSNPNYSVILGFYKGQTKRKYKYIYTYTITTLHFLVLAIDLKVINKW